MTNTFYIIIPLFIFLFGLAIGSFLNVLVLRMRTGMSLGGRSGCFSCGHELSWKELIPVLSFVMLKGRCKNCSSKISWQYPLVEISVAVLFLLVWFLKKPDMWNFVTISIGLINFAIMAVFVAIFVYDIKHKIIPDSFVISLIVLGLLQTALMVYQGGGFMLFVHKIIASLFLFFPFFVLWSVSRGRWIGLGDGKLALAFGFLLPFTSAISGIVMAFWLGALVSIFLLSMQGKQVGMKTQIPFAPFLIIGALIVFFYPLDLFHLELFREILGSGLLG